MGPKRKLGKPKSKGKSSLKLKENECHFVFTGQIGTSMTASNSSGLYVGTRIEVDTDFCARTVLLGSFFEQWKVNWLELEYRPLYGTTTVGQTGHCMLKDPTDASPGSAQAAGDLAQSPTPAHVFSKLNKRYNPGKGWLYCKDSGTSDDRFEMPGDVVFWTENTAVSQIMGTLHFTMSVSFRNFVPTSVNASTLKADDGSTLWQALVNSEVYRIPESKITRYTVEKSKVEEKQAVLVLDDSGQKIGMDVNTITNNVVTSTVETALEKAKPEVPNKPQKRAAARR